MAVKNALFIFEVVVADVTSFVDSRNLVIRSEFSDIFSLELIDPKTMQIVMPEPLPLPPEPPGKKGKKKKPKPKPKKKKGKVVEVLPPPKPDIQSGQSVLFTSNAEFLLENMLKYPMNVSLWSKEKQFSYIGSTSVPWDPVFINFLKYIINCQEPPPVWVRDDYNIFEERTAKVIAKIGMKVTVRYLTERITSSFRSLSEDPSVRKFLYTGMNSKVTSYICNMRTDDAHFDKNCNKIQNSFIKHREQEVLPIKYADYKNAPGVNILNIEPFECCLKQADKLPDSKYKAPRCPDIDFINDYVQKIIVSCNDAMRSLTPRPTIRPRVRATDIDRLCYCRETSWPQSTLADRFRQEVQGPPCPICINKGKPQGGPFAATFDLTCLRGPCGSTDCKVARQLREYIQQQVLEDNEVFNLDSLIGPCGSRSCTLAEQISNFLQHRGAFEHAIHTKEGQSTQCNCYKQMRDALMKRRSSSCTEVCSKDCEDASSSNTIALCSGTGCPNRRKPPEIYQVYYFTVEYDKTPTDTRSSTPARSTASSQSCSSEVYSKITSKSSESSPFKHCSSSCPTVKDKTSVCSKSVCFSPNHEELLIKQVASNKCVAPVCPTKQSSPSDSHVVIPFSSIPNPCCVKDCKVEQDVKDFIMRGLETSAANKLVEDPCYCDCICDMKFTKRTTYCAVCGGYECLGDDIRTLPEYQKPHPCPVYNKLYNRTLIRTRSPWPDEDKKAETPSARSMKTASSKGAVSAKQKMLPTNDTNERDKKKPQQIKIKAKNKRNNKNFNKFTVSNVEQTVKRHIVCNTAIIPVPKNMGWNWKADDIPGLKYRPEWKPGCAHKRLVSHYRAIREPLESVLAKKKLKAMMLGKKKKVKNLPTVTVTKKNGEYTVQMEVLKKYSKERLVNQYPFDETKKPLVYTIGKTEEEKARIQKHHARRERRRTRRQTQVVQSAFRDKCQEICVKAYNQAIGLLPLPNPNIPTCPCDLETVHSSPPAESCSCSETASISSSDTDNDEWTIEFYAPSARWEPQVKPPPRGCDGSSQYTYLDYRVKLNDSQGNPIPRFFIGPDGKEVCSDLGGFWSPDHSAWLEINKDGYIGPDNRWVPMSFIGPDGMVYTSDDGYFRDKLKDYKIGVDGYIDVNGKWAWYPRALPKESKTKTVATVTTTEAKKAQLLALRKTAANARTKAAPEKKDAVAVTTTAAVAAVPAAPTSVPGSTKAAPVAPKPAHGSKVARGKPRPVISAPDRGLFKVSLPYGARANKHRCQLYMAKGEKGVLNIDKSFYEGLMSPPSKYNELKKTNKYNEIMGDFNVYENLLDNRAASPQTVNRACMTNVEGEPKVKPGSHYGMNLRPKGRTHPRLRPIDSMKIYGIESMKPRTMQALRSRSGVVTGSATCISVAKH